MPAAAMPGTIHFPNTIRLSRHTLRQKGTGSMDAIMNFLGNTWVMVGMAVALLALIGMMIFLRMKPRDED